MAESFLARITPVSGPEGPVDPDYGVGGGRPSHPIALPPLPGIWPKPGEPSHPIYIPPDVPGVPSHPIYIEGSPEHPIALPPGQPPVTIWPPLPPDLGFGNTGKVAVFVWIPGVGSRWAVVDTTVKPTPQK